MSRHETKALLRDLKRDGWTIVDGRHWQAIPPWGGKAIYFAKTPRGGSRSIENTRAHIRRAVREHERTLS